jgi:hypothetical protein
VEEREEQKQTSLFAESNTNGEDVHINGRQDERKVKEKKSARKKATVEKQGSLFGEKEEVKKPAARKAEKEKKVVKTFTAGDSIELEL